MTIDSISQTDTRESAHYMNGRAQYIWLAYSGFFFIDPVLRHDLRYWLECSAIYAVFLGLYIALVNTRAPRTRCLFIAAFYLLGMLSFPFNSGSTAFFIYSAAFLPFAVESVVTARLVLVAQCFGVAAETFLLRGMHLNFINAGIAVFFIAVVGGANTFIAQQKHADSKLRMAHEEIEQLAALAERERIARDLHDVLGHTLSVIVLKAELAGRLIERDPARAATEIGDVERTARTALAEVREAIGGYRSKGLAAEMELARNTLTSAGVALSCESPIPRLNPAEETVLALALREAVTNIVRHARAAQCRIAFQTTQEGFHSLTVEDDGAGMPNSPALPHEGNGLRGMRERVQSLGGRLSISNSRGASSPGTALRIEVPIVAAARSNPTCATA